MQKIIKHTLAAAAIALLLYCQNLATAASSSPDSNWPQWRGPLANGVAPAGRPPVTWSETNNVKWKVKLPGAGTSTPIIWGNQIFVQTAVASAKKNEAEAANIRLPAVTGLADPAAQTPPARRRPPVGGMRSEKPTQPYQFLLL